MQMSHRFDSDEWSRSPMRTGGRGFLGYRNRSALFLFPKILRPDILRPSIGRSSIGRSSIGRSSIGRSSILCIGILCLGILAVFFQAPAVSLAQDTGGNRLDQLLDRAKGISTKPKPRAKQEQRALSKQQSSGFLSSGSQAKKADPYAPKPVLSLIVNGKREDHLSNALRKLSWLAKHRDVKVGSVLIAGRHASDEKSRQRVLAQVMDKDGRQKQRVTDSVAGRMAVGPQVYPYIEEVGLSQYEVIESRKVIERLNITYSPTWIVRHLGRDYIFEGYQNPIVLFDKNGGFLGE